MQAALGAEDPCDGVGAKNGGFKTEEYDWNYYVGYSSLAYYAKKGGPADQRDYDFMIEFDGGKPRVWVEDAEEWKDKKCGDIIKLINETQGDSTKYQSYVLSITFNKQNCGNYGSGQESVIEKQFTKANITLRYVTPCIITAALCNGLMPGLGVADFAGNVLGCTVGGFITAYTYRTELIQNSFENMGFAAKTSAILLWATGGGIATQHILRGTSIDVAASRTGLRTTITFLKDARRLDPIIKSTITSGDTISSFKDIQNFGKSIARLEESTGPLIQKLQKTGHIVEAEMINSAFQDDSIKLFKELAYLDKIDDPKKLKDLKTFLWEKYKISTKKVDLRGLSKEKQVKELKNAIKEAITKDLGMGEKSKIVSAANEARQQIENVEKAMSRIKKMGREYAKGLFCSALSNVIGATTFIRSLPSPDALTIHLSTNTVQYIMVATNNITSGGSRE
ncbi:hypothetical protein JCM16138_05360 [Thermococcus atlanticus]